MPVSGPNKTASRPALIYITHTRLMQESENTVRERALRGEQTSRRVCSQVLGDAARYHRWHNGQDRRMDDVAKRRRRELQILNLRAAALEQIHRTALVSYLREHRITGAARDQTLADFYGVMDPREATILEHHHYLIAASSRLCALDLLELTGDVRGRELIDDYESRYGEFFAMFCDRSRAQRLGLPYLQAALLPESRQSAARLRQRILEGDRLPVPPLRAVPLSRGRGRPVPFRF